MVAGLRSGDPLCTIGSRGGTCAACVNDEMLSTPEDRTSSASLAVPLLTTCGTDDVSPEDAATGDMMKKSEAMQRSHSEVQGNASQDNTVQCNSRCKTTNHDATRCKTMRCNTGIISWAPSVSLPAVQDLEPPSRRGVRP